ncbi:MAG: sigma-70 family RNA polymerase sigma factor [Oscillospiraceae bacterium]|nr:sigma-70 family RNA polymerase sigma factor [Oscillospiraceae bacterium]
MNNKGSTLSAVIDSFMPYIEKKAYGLNVPGLDINDFRQEAIIALASAIETYDESRDARFSTYAITCINNRLTDMVRSASSGKNKLLNESLSLSGEDEQNASSYVESPEEMVIIREEYRELLAKIAHDLTELERDALLMFNSGYSYAEIAEKKNTTPKAIGNALQRARNKLKKD